MFEKTHQFKWDSVFVKSVDSVYHSRGRVFYRLAQVYCESGFNPLATSDFANWKRQKMDTITAIRTRKGAAGLSQFIWPTAERYGATTINPSQAEADTFCSDIYNPRWSLPAMSRYMVSIERLLMTTKNRNARRALLSDIHFRELCVTSGYNTGEGRMLGVLNRSGGDWEVIKYEILPEPRLYAERIVSIARIMRTEARWQSLK